MYQKSLERFLRSRFWNRAKQSSTWRNLVAYPHINAIINQLKGSPRLYLPKGHSLDRLAREFDQCGVQYVVLRFFSELPSLDGLNDLDILIRDQDYQNARRILTSRRSNGVLPVDLHTVTGIPEMRSDGAYIPPHLAMKILNSGEQHVSGLRVPDDESYFFSLAIHAAYRKGWSSGIPSENGSRGNGHQTKYETELARLANANGLNLPITLESLDVHLEAQGWRPPLDQLLLWSQHNEWLEIRLQSRPGQDADLGQPGLVCLLVRESHSSQLDLQRITHEMTKVGFIHVSTRFLPDSTVQSLVQRTRGGNWPQETGGPPKVASAYVWPGEISDTQLFEIVQSTKDRIRHLLRGRGFRTRSLTVLHSSDSPLLAAEYVRLAFGTCARDLVSEALQGDGDSPSVR